MPVFYYMTGRYDINLATQFIGSYDILAAAEWEWVVQIQNKSYTHANFYNGKIVRKLQQIHTFNAVFHDLTADDLTRFIKQGSEIRVVINSRVIFTGEITRVIKTDTTKTWSVECNSIAIKLKNRKINSLYEWVDTEANTIIETILPSTCWRGTIETAQPIDYKTEYSDILEQVSNICQQTNFEWDCRENYVEVTATLMQDLGWQTYIEFSGTTYAAHEWLMSSCSNPYRWFFAFALNNSVKNKGAYVSDNGPNWFLCDPFYGDDPTPFCPFSNGDSGTKFRIYLDYKLDYKDSIGRTTPVDTLKIGREVIYAERTNDIGRVITKVVIPGQSSGAETFNSVYSANTNTITSVTYSEPYLTNEVTASSTTLNVSTTNGIIVPGNVYCEGEQIHYSGKTSTSLTNCTRGMVGTTPAIHTYGAPVVSRDFLYADSTAAFDSSGILWIGMECIAYTYKDYSGFWDLTRGYDNSTIYNHASGIHIRDAQWTDESPEPSSPVEMYGVLEDVKPSKGGVNRNALDFYAQSQIAIKSTLKEWGNAIIVGPTLRNELTYGDHVYIQERDSSTNTDYRVMGMVWDMMKGKITLEFGDTEEWLLDKLSSVDRIQQQATIRSNQPQLGTVTQVSASGRTAYVTLDSGEMVIARIQ